MLSELKVVVTGGASGMGRCFAVELARAGASVAVAERIGGSTDAFVAPLSSLMLALMNSTAR